MTSNQATPGMPDEQRSAIVHQIAQDWTVVHGGSPGCLTGFMSMSDQMLLNTAREYRAKAAATIGDDR